MLLFINRYFRRPSNDIGGRRDKGQLKEEGEKKMDMLSFCAGEASHPCAHGCLAAPLLSLMEPSNPKHRTTTTTRISRSNFAKSTTSSLFPNTHFTNHESLPPLADAFFSFSAVYPRYAETQQADHIRDREYYHLMNHVCLDYTGFNLFSHAQMRSSVAGPPPSGLLQPPFFNISYKSASLKSRVLYGNQETVLESAIRRRIMDVLNISDEEYSMVCTANRTTAFRLLAESYPFHSNKRLLTVYDYESEAVGAMAESAQKKGAKLMSASFTWPSLRIHSARLRKKVSKRKKKRRGLFVFPLQSRMTGARYPYLWMAMAQENGWHVVLDACALGPKDMDTLGLSLIKPDFIICSFFKVFGENPAGFAGLFIKKSSSAVLETSAIARSIGVVSIVPARTLSQLPDDYSGTDLDAQSSKFQLEEDDAETTSSFSGPIPTRICNGSSRTDDGLAENPSSVKQIQNKRFEQGETSQIRGRMVSKEEEEEEENAERSPEIVQLEDGNSVQAARTAANSRVDKSMEIECRGLDHADSLGLILISSRLRYITNWLVIALMKLRHPHSENGHALIRIYGPRIKFDRGPAIAFNVFDWKGEKVEPALVQKLADRSNISLSCGFIHNIWFSDKYEAEKDAVLERKVGEITVASKRKESIDLGINVVNASLGYLTNFEDAYKLWAFIAKFLDADFVEKEKWRYMALNQKMIEV
ncbi:molybdenum cofactor sulfurase 3-like [Cocos nucifera]|uniref:Molybdenum cofactor sulfurase 3-like n=1 Tax=Cocos nucifera TaxID=13894 RepID=A0A8K0IJM4_COCNU|nr:molybdenum cofactor sulfurase 3-like [Cocos nucifera]